MARKDFNAWELCTEQSWNGIIGLPGSDKEQLASERLSVVGRAHHPLQQQCQSAGLALNFRTVSIPKTGKWTTDRLDHRCPALAWPC